MEIKKGIIQIELGFVNAYLLVEDDGLILIDAVSPGTTRRLIRSIRALGYQPQNIKAALITHADFDHIGAINTLRKFTYFPVYASQISADALLQGKSSRDLNVSPFAQMLVGIFTWVVFRKIKVDQIIEDGSQLPFMGGIQVVATPGHTPGHLSFFLPRHKILFAGDSMRANQQGLIPGNFKPITWDQEKHAASIKKQSMLGAEFVCVGHGPVTSQATSDSFPIK